MWRRQPLTCKSDVYSLGTVLAHIIALISPRELPVFNAGTHPVLSHPNWTDCPAARYPPRLRDIATEMLSIDPTARPDVDALLREEPLVAAAMDRLIARSSDPPAATPRIRALADALTAYRSLPH